MRRILLALVCVLFVLMCSSGLLLIRRSARASLAPPGATNVRVYRHGLSELHVTYQTPPTWTLQDLISYHNEQGWARDTLTERSLQRPWMESPSTVFAVFTRRSLFGMAPELAVIGMSTDNQRTLQVRMTRCLKIEPWIGCL